MLFGFLFLRETMTPRQVVAIGFAVAGVAVLVVGAGELPLIAVSLGLTFATYGLLRKTIPVDGASGMFVESLILGPIAPPTCSGWRTRGRGASPKATPPTTGCWLWPDR